MQHVVAFGGDEGRSDFEDQQYCTSGARKRKWKTRNFALLSNKITTFRPTRSKHETVRLSLGGQKTSLFSSKFMLFLKEFLRVPSSEYMAG